jgi:hypothetical protein
MNIVALLESMWGWRGYSEAGDVIRYFRINPDNFSGRRLYSLIGPSHSLLVTNSCRECQRSANDHGTPDPAWVGSIPARAGEPGRNNPRNLACSYISQPTYL